MPPEVFGKIHQFPWKFAIKWARSGQKFVARLSNRCSGPPAKLLEDCAMRTAKQIAGDKPHPNAVRCRSAHTIHRGPPTSSLDDVPIAQASADQKGTP
jgi:hypothetical protein